MKIAHWVIRNPSGMHHLAMAMVQADELLGHTATLIDCEKEGEWLKPEAIEADLHVVHTFIPDIQRARIANRTGKPPKIVFVSHGIPEHTIETTVSSILSEQNFEARDLWMLARFWLKEADAFVVFSPRQQAIWQSMCPKSTRIDCVPMGVDRAFWAGGTPRGTGHAFGNPAVWMSENQNRIKWALDVLLAWPFVIAELPQAFLHAHLIPYDLHRWLVDIANTNGAAYRATISPRFFPYPELRERWGNCDFMLATTRYGDNTVLTMQANAAGLPVISYPGNEYATYWIAEGDQRVMARELVAIFDGTTPPRAALPAPDLREMGEAMQLIYERVLGGARHNVAIDALPAVEVSGE